MSIEAFNNKVASKLADYLSTMAMFYGVCFLVISILFFQMPNSPLEWVQFVIQTFFQGAALPVLGFVSKMESEKTNRIIKEIHDATMSELKDIKDMHTDIHNILTAETNDFSIESNTNNEIKQVNKAIDEMKTKIDNIIDNFNMS